MRSAAIFAIFGFVAALVQAFGQQSTVEQTLRAGLGWAAGFGLLGWGIGRVARSIAREALPGRNPEEDRAAPTEDGRTGRAWARPSGRFAGGITPPAGGTWGRERRQGSHRV